MCQGCSEPSPVMISDALPALVKHESSVMTHHALLGVTAWPLPRTARQAYS